MGVPNFVKPYNTVSGGTFTYVGQNQKLEEGSYALAPIQMGARVYIPGLGRFLSVDPVQGGTPNNYVYPVDPVNDFDLDGSFGWKSIAKIASAGSMIPGPIGMVSAGAAAASYAAVGDKKQAAIAVLTIAAAGVGAGGVVTVCKAAKIAKAARAGEDLSKMRPAGKITSNVAGKMFVGMGAKKEGIKLVSRDGLRSYRAPAIKSNGSYMANFEKRLSATTAKRKAWKFPNKYYNGHLNIRR